MHAFRTHNCAELRKDHVGQTVKLSGWVNRKRDHGGLLFIDLRDTFGVTQIVIDSDSPLLGEVEKWRNEFVVMITGKVVERAAEVVNAKLPTGEIEVRVEAAEVLSTAEVIPFQVAEDDNAGEDVRLRYRYLDLRREKMQKKIRLRNDVISSMR
ncbi:MAG: OB-fold nucleic acid binding domain-containing protein, partial [Pseudomonadota bacterium]|nr:OB-fold nucleic acid binding domain-containing protein [Pseudomonadota bacterium]